MNFPRVHREGHRFLMALLLFLLGIGWGAQYLVSGAPILFSIWMLLGCVFVFFLQFFFVVRARMVPSAPDEVCAPATGRIIRVAEVSETEYFQDKRKMISIFLSIFDPHDNRCPVGGKVLYARHWPGKFLVAFAEKASALNERASLVIQTPGQQRVLVRQIAGFLARRIKQYRSEGDDVVQGQEFGFIKFGSRVDVFLPLDATILVSLGQRVQGGTTLLARFS